MSVSRIPGASVTVINTDTDVSHDYTTNESGFTQRPSFFRGITR